MSIANTIAGQLDHTKPDKFVPGIDVGFKATTQDGMEGLRFCVLPRRVHGVVLYDAGPDTYIVHITMPNGERVTYSDVYCDQLGHIVWGADVAKPYVLPMVAIKSGDEPWEVIA